VPSKTQSSSGGEGGKVKEEKKKRRKKGADAADARDKAVDEVRARAAVLGGQRTADVMQLLGASTQANRSLNSKPCQPTTWNPFAFMLGQYSCQAQFFVGCALLSIQESITFFPIMRNE